MLATKGLLACLLTPDNGYFDLDLMPMFVN